MAIFRLAITRQCKLIRLAFVGILLVLVLPIRSPAQAQELDGTTIMKLALQGTWETEYAEYGYWSWAEDKTVCLKLGSPEENCADTGTWAISDNAVCYELTW
jgi:hypothetical protein